MEEAAIPDAKIVAHPTCGLDNKSQEEVPDLEIHDCAPEALRTREHENWRPWGESKSNMFSKIRDSR